MTIEEIQKRAVQLENDALALVREFEAETGVYASLSVSRGIVYPDNMTASAKVTIPAAKREAA